VEKLVAALRLRLQILGQKALLHNPSCATRFERGGRGRMSETAIKPSGASSTRGSMSSRVGQPEGSSCSLTPVSSRSAPARTALRHVYACVTAVVVLLLTVNSAHGELPPAKKAHWNDENIVHDGKNWVHIPEEVYGHPHAPYDDRWKQNSSTIMVLVAALRETRLPLTLKSAFDNADFPERIRFGVVQQNKPTDEDSLAKLCELRDKPLIKTENGEYENPNGCVEFDKVRLLRLDASEAAGPVYARGLQPELLQDEDFCLQIDAHTIFKKGWDRDLLREWGLTNNEFAVLSTYPTNYKDLGKNSNKHWEMPHICGAKIGGGGYISNKQAGAAANLKKPLLAPLWAAGFSFSRCHAERWVPNDKHLRHVFSGEEFHRAARLWTNGYDFYSITRPTIGVYYGSEKGGSGGWHSNKAEYKKSIQRLMTAIEFKDSDQSPEARAELGEYVLGTRRTIDQYIAFSGVDVRNVVAKDRCLVEYVPWDDSGLKEKIEQEERELKEKYKQSSLGSSSQSEADVETAKSYTASKVSATGGLLRSKPFDLPPFERETGGIAAAIPLTGIQASSALPPKPGTSSLARLSLAGIFIFFCGLRGLFELRRRGMLRDWRFKGRRAQ